MLSFSPATRIFVALSPVDMRAGFNRLYAHVQTTLQQDPLRGLRPEELQLLLHGMEGRPRRHWYRT
jgi:hypothetical protein